MSDDKGFELVSYNGFRDEDANARMAERVAYDLLRSWRSRLDPENWAGDVQLARTYTLKDGREIALDSANAAAVKVTHTSKDDNVKTYEFGFADERGSLTVYGIPEDADPLAVYDDFSRLLFDCDQVEMGGA